MTTGNDLELNTIAALRSALAAANERIASLEAKRARIDRDQLGKVVREAWVGYCIDTNHIGKPSHLKPWEELSEWDKEADRCIGEVVLAFIAGAEPTPQLDAIDKLITAFSDELIYKLKRSRDKYGYSNEPWMRDDWEGGCIEAMRKHLRKGDPRDVAAYCAFMWHHGWSTEEVLDDAEAVNDDSN